MLQNLVKEKLELCLQKVKHIHEIDLLKGYGKLELPHTISRKFKSPTKKGCWQYVFPASNRSVDSDSRIIRRCHADEKMLQKVEKVVVRKVEVHKTANCHIIKHRFAIHILEAGYDIRKV